MGSDQKPHPQPTSNEQMYDIVPGGQNAHVKQETISEKPAPPPDRRVTTNTIYEPSSGTVHPQTLPTGYTLNGDTDVETEFVDDSSSSCLRTVCLSLMVGVSLFLAVIAVALVLLLWFGVIDTSTPDCPTSSETITMTTSPPVVTEPLEGSCSCSGKFIT